MQFCENMPAEMSKRRNIRAKKNMLMYKQVKNASRSITLLVSDISLRNETFLKIKKYLFHLDR